MSWIIIGSSRTAPGEKGHFIKYWQFRANRTACDERAVSRLTRDIIIVLGKLLWLSIVLIATYWKTNKTIRDCTPSLAMTHLWRHDAFFLHDPVLTWWRRTYVDIIIIWSYLAMAKETMRFFETDRQTHLKGLLSHPSRRECNDHWVDIEQCSLVVRRLKWHRTHVCTVIGVNRPAIVREIPHSVFLPAFPHFCENVSHFLLYLRKNRIHWKSLWFSSPQRYFVDKSCAKTHAARSCNVFDT